MRPVLLSALCLCATAAAVRNTVPYRGAHEQCLGGKVHTLTYDAVGLDGASFVDLDGDLGSHLSSMSCDIDHTRLTLNFHSAALATEWVVKFHDFTDHFIVGGTRWNCTSASSRPGYILRRVVGASQGAHLSKTLTITTAMAQYDEVFETAEIAYASSSAACDAAHPRWAAGGPLSLGAGAGAGADKRVCLGWNTACDGAAAQSYPLFSNDKLSVECSDCWASLETDVFVNISIGGWKLRSLRGGFSNTTLNASAAVDARAAKSWNLALDKSLPIATTAYLLNFKIGSVPMQLYFDIPMTVTASLEFDTAAELTLGTAASLVLGDAYVSWDPTHHWTHTLPKPDFAHAVRPVLRKQGEAASLDVTGQLQLSPAFNLHFDQVFSYSLQATPNAHAAVHAAEATQQACLSATYDLDLVSSAQAHINIDLLDFHRDWTWGPTNVFSKAGNVVPQTCVPL